ncbi:MAG: electron transfer flavoprotein subunit alpha/FixB family protein [Desulfatiglans sp.]|jgi:electron transfer flavoprotein alpha subunit|nr:electron transfer flavoprotein subunit alpha/FixB family protein [Desulfatiglans sp.]
MSDILVLIEHRLGEIRDISFEMLNKAHDLSEQLNAPITAVLFGKEVASLADQITDRVDRVLLIEDDKLEVFHSNLSKELLSTLINDRKPKITLIGNTSWGMGLAPGVAVKTDIPLATDCVDVQVDDGSVSVIRQIYSGKVFTKVAFPNSDSCLVSIRPGSFPPDKKGDRKCEVEKMDFPFKDEELKREFVEYIETAAGDVDITQADFLISVGRGIKEAENIDLIRELADTLGGVMSCSRPVVDNEWLPKYLQVGTSGKSVAPKVYMPIGISGAFQHVAGIAGAGSVIAVNKDPKAPIFRVADYGIVADLFKFVPILKDKVAGNK